MVEVQSITFPEGITLQCGEKVAPLRVAHQTYGTLSPKRDNVIVICHAFTGDQYVASPHPVTGKPGWWSRMVGPGLPIDTDRFFVICTNVLGGCMGTTGPTSERAGTGRPWGKDFPPVTMHDIVAAQVKLIDHFGIDRLFAVIGGSMGGMQVLTWATDYPDRVFAAMPIATSPFQSAQNIAFNEVSRQAIYGDPNWHGGDYQAHGVIPARGLAVARMVGHITYLSEEALTRKFGREIRPGTVPSSGDPLSALPFGGMFQVESYLRYQGSNFTRRFDAHSYLTISRAMDFFDLGSEHEGNLSAAFRGVKTRFCVVSFSSDWLFPTSRSRTLVRAINQAGGHVSFVEIDSDRGHDAFLLEEPDFDRTIRGFLNGMARQAGLSAGECDNAV